MKYIDRASGKQVEQVDVNRFEIIGAEYPTVIVTHHTPFLMPMPVDEQVRHG